MSVAVVLGVIGGAANLIGAFMGGNQAEKDRAFAREQQRKLEAAQAKVRAALETYQGNEEERIAAMKILNGEYDEATAKRISQLTESLGAANAAFSIDSQSAIDNYINGMDAMLANYNADAATAIQTFSSTVTKSIQETATKNLQQINMTKQEVDALIDQFSADSSANIANFAKETGLATGEMAESLNAMIAEYDASQAGRNQALSAALGNASEGFKQAVQKEAIVRDKIIGDNLKLTGQVLANTNEGVSQILGITPEENLQKAQAAATDFATAYAESAGTAAGNQAQQAARQSGVTKGAAALMGTTAASNATNQQFNQAAATGLNAYQGAQAAQVKALEEQYARQRELAQANMDQANLAKQEADANAEKAANMEREDAKHVAQEEQEDAQFIADEKKAAAIQISDDKRENADKAAGMEKDRIEGVYHGEDGKIQNEKDLGKAIVDANSEAAQGIQTAAKDTLDAKMEMLESGKQTQETALNNVRQDSKDKAYKEHENATGKAKTISDEQGKADTQHYINELGVIEAGRQKDLVSLDTEQDMANQQAGISGNASNMAAASGNNFANQVTGLGAGLADVAAIADKPKSDKPPAQ